MQRGSFATSNALGYLPLGGSAEDMASVQRSDVALMEELVRLTGASAD